FSMNSSSSSSKSALVSSNVLIFVQISVKMLDFESIIEIPTPLQNMKAELFDRWGVDVWVKRDDLTHPFISGNKFRKLQYNLLQAEKEGKDRLITFGGAYSNHLAAFAFACREFGFRGKAVVRGEELKADSSPTLAFAHSMGIELEFVSREAYRNKQELVGNTDDYVIPEGGSNAVALPGVGAIIAEIGAFDYLLTACGTGGTMAGLLQAAPPEATIIGVSALKGGDFLEEEVVRLLGRPFPENAHLETGFHFGGYARHTPELIRFIRSFELQHGIRLEQVYTGKMVFAFYNLLAAGHFPRGSTVVLLHTGGLQGRLPALDKSL
ncbi:MAG TPA: pyridoxal-phosphate dependent enzyme, partial [Cyclobacteriaceae bacterium]|nr:pyridoxal-phosphate dependent enzyme [Cyclobacteriaceae bacterium]